MSVESWFAGRSFMVTGASSGIGLGAARALARQGARVVLVGRDEERLRGAQDSLGGEGHTRVLCDLLREDALPAAMERIRSHGASLDGAVLSAGAHQVRPFQVSKTQHFREMFGANVETAVNGVKLFLKNAHSDGGSIVLLSSVAALHGGGAVSAYSAAKGALVSLGKCLAGELATKRIRVNTVLPGVVMTAMTEKFFAGLLPAQVEAIQKAHPLGLGQVEDVVGTIEYLLSPAARWMTGSDIVIDGGFTSR